MRASDEHDWTAQEMIVKWWPPQGYRRVESAHCAGTYTRTRVTAAAAAALPGNQQTNRRPAAGRADFCVEGVARWSKPAGEGAWFSCFWKPHFSVTIQSARTVHEYLY